MKIRSLLSGMIILACSLAPALARDYEITLCSSLSSAVVLSR